MSSPQAQAGSPPSSGSEDKPRLSAEQKKANHIASERKRRTEIRQQFDRLTTIVPHTKGMARSEAIVLRRTVDALKAEEAERKRLIARLEELGERVEDEFKR
ncbi:hypothetical protein B0O99DRAFT_507837 [Bisporella sp. PMI_857]|nr:hypothetical protein B0O99DRAFT_507837 [Bisporella sp. PMI_857]